MESTRIPVSGWGMARHTRSRSPASRCLGTSALITGMVVFMGACALGAGQGPDVSRWSVQKIRLSPFELVFRVPGGGSTAAPPRPTIPWVDLERDVRDTKRGVVVFGHTWEWDGGFLGRTFGLVSVDIGVIRNPPDYEKSIVSIENLQEMIQRDLETSLTPHNERMRSTGQLRFVVTLPDRYDQLKLHQTTWLTYRFTGSKDQIIYVTPLGPSHYLNVGFSFADNSRGHKTNWREEAQAVADQIVASLELRRVE